MKHYFLVIDPEGDVEEPYGLFVTTLSLSKIQRVLNKCQDTEEMYETLAALGCEEIPYATLEF